MKQVLDRLCEALDRGERSVLVTVLEKSGSAPRGAGACMLLTRAGAFGTIGGGSAEHAAILTAERVLETGEARVEVFRMSPNEIADLGMICGGTVQALFHPIPPAAESGAVFSMLREALRDGRDAWLLRRFEGGDCAQMRVLTERDGEWTFPKPVYAQTGLGFTFCEPIASAARVLVFGGGHVAARLVPLLHFLGMRAVVYEDRAEFADRERFPDADGIVCAGFAELAAQLTVRPADSIVVMTRGHQADHTVLTQALKTEAGYIGCIGSRKKIAITRDRLLAEGFSERDIARIHMPVGLPIGAETPEEIAVSIAAELIRCRRCE